MMQKTLLFATILLFMIGCGGDEEEATVEEPSLVGSWVIESLNGETLDEFAASILSQDGIETRATQKDYVFVADSSWYANLGFQGEIDLGSGLSFTIGVTFALKGNYTVSGSRLSSVLEEVNVTLEPRNLWELIGVTGEAIEQALRGYIFSAENETWSLLGNTLTLTDDEGGKTVLIK